MKTVKSCGFPDYKTLHFEWFFTDWCNYACSYCSAATMMSEAFSKEDSPSIYKLTLSRLLMLDTPFNVELLGGEPTLHPNIEEVLLTLNQTELCTKIEVVTNLSRSLSFFESLNKPELNKTTILASYHPEYFKESFVEKCVAVTKMEHLDFMVNVNLFDKPDTWQDTIRFINELKDNNVNYGFNFLNPTPTYNPNYTKEFFKLFEPYLETRQKNDFPYEFTDGTITTLSESQIIEHGYNRFNGYKCYPTMYRIMNDGVIKNICTNKVVSITMKDMFKQEICPRNFCDCDIMYNFYKEQV